MQLTVTLLCSPLPTHYYLSVFVFYFFETESGYVAQASLRSLAILLPHPHRIMGEHHTPSCPVLSYDWQCVRLARTTVTAARAPGYTWT